MIKSPIFYMGNKEKLIRRGLVDLFPKNINTFIDLFCGSGVVSLNVKANNRVLNDNDNNTIDLIRYFKDNNPEDIVCKINELIDTYGMPTFSTDARKFDGDRNIFKERYNKLREDYNKTKDVELLYMLNIFSNSHMIRFNSSGEFNMPFGNGYFTDKCRDNIIENTYNKIVNITNYDFRRYINYNFKNNDFVYLDPPYLNTTATYNENGAWTELDEQDLLNFCDELNKKNVRFALSNVFKNKGVVNQHLIDWCNERNYNIHYFGDFTYCSCGKGNSNTVEVLITNY